MHTFNFILFFEKNKNKNTHAHAHKRHELKNGLCQVPVLLINHYIQFKICNQNLMSDKITDTAYLQAHGSFKSVPYASEIQSRCVCLKILKN